MKTQILKREPWQIEFQAGVDLAFDGQQLPDAASPSARAGWEAAMAEPTGREHIGATFSVRCHVPHLRPVEVPVSEPEVDPYAELKAAHAAGKQIQCIDSYGAWNDMLLAPNWSLPPNHYRIKPEPVKVPMGPEDVPPGSVFRPIGGGEWRSIQGPTESGVVAAFVGTVIWGDLAKRYEISRDFGKTWHPCWKEVAQ